MGNKSTRKHLADRRRRHTRKQSKFKKSNCSPSLKKKTYSCYSHSALHKMRDLWNARHPDEKIHSSEPREIWTNLKNNLDDVCDKESCWLKQKFIKHNLDKELLSYTFAPKSPKIWEINPNEWLTSTDISNVMKQYEKTYPCFSFIGPSPIDYDAHEMDGECVWEELCKFELKDYLKEGKRKIGVVFNIDPHYLDGSHWIALFININTEKIFYFDSNGDPVPRHIKKLVKTITKQGEKEDIDFKFDCNHPFEHQQGDTECGIYVLYFLINSIKETKPFSFYKKHRISDDAMERLRKIYFNQ